MFASARYEKQVQMTLSVIRYGPVLFFFFYSPVVQINELLVQSLNIHKGGESPGTTSVENKSKHCFHRVID